MIFMFYFVCTRWTAIASLDAFATQLNISRSEFVERIARGDGEAIALLANSTQSNIRLEK